MIAIVAAMTASCGAACSATTVDDLPPGTALAILLTTESLLFAALNVGVAFAAPVAKGRQLWLSPRSLAVAAAATIAVLAVGAGAAWGQIFWLPWEHGIPMAIEGFCLLGGIIMEPLLALAIALNVPKRHKGAD